MSWFDTVCGWCEAGSKATLNFVSCGNQWGDRFYGAMDVEAVKHMGGIAAQTHEEALKQALAQGASKMQAEIIANHAVGAKMDAFISPDSISDVGDLLSSGAAIGGKTIGSALDISAGGLGSLLPIIIGAGVLGGAYLMLDNLSPTPRRMS